MFLSSILVSFMIILLAILLMSGFPVAFTLAGTALFVAFVGLALDSWFGMSVGILDWSYIGLFPDRIFGLMLKEVFLAVPLFIFMGVMLEKSRIAEELLESMGQLFGSVRGGLGISVTIVGALLAASTGIVGATVVTMGLLSLPTMLRHGYDPKLAAGSITAAGTLGQIIPPSIVLVLLGDVMSSSYQEAQRAMGAFSTQPISVGDLFAGALLPGLGLVIMFIIYQILMAYFKPETSPAILPKDGEVFDRAFVFKLLGALLPPIILIVAVLGSILSGGATPTSAAALGAVGATMLAGLKQANKSKNILLLGKIGFIGALIIAYYNRGISLSPIMMGLALLFTGITTVGLLKSIQLTFKKKILQDVMDQTLRISTMVFTILVGAAMFSLVFRGIGGDELIANILNNLPGGPISALIVVMLVMFILGFFLDFLEITFVVVPIVAPILIMMGYNPIWLGVMMAMNLQTSFLTPPFGFALFYLRGVAEKSVKTSDIYKGALPFVGIQMIALVLLAVFPELATWLPEVIFGRN